MAHYKLDWHKYNLKRKLKGLTCIGEDEFETLSGMYDIVLMLCIVCVYNMMLIVVHVRTCDLGDVCRCRVSCR